MNITLEKFQFNKEIEWNLYIDIFINYINELYKDNNEILQHLKTNKYKNEILNLTTRENNIFYIMQIKKDNKLIGFIDYICYLNENGKCVIGNFYIYPKYRNLGIGTNICKIVESNLKKLGGNFIEITPNKKAINLYNKLQYKCTNIISKDNNLLIYKKFI